jgi:hypothetical protein
MGCQHGHAIEDCPDERCRGGENTLDSLADCLARMMPVKPAPKCVACDGTGNIEGIPFPRDWVDCPICTRL